MFECNCSQIILTDMQAGSKSEAFASSFSGVVSCRYRAEREKRRTKQIVFKSRRELRDHFLRKV